MAIPNLAAPPPNKAFDFSPLPVAQQGEAKDSNAEPKVDFRQVLQNSNSDTTRERQAKRSGDLSGAKTTEEFYKALSDRMNPTRVPKNQLGKDDFLKLFVAQMQNQDPLSPKDNSEMAAQLAQFNGLEQMMNVNKTLEEMMKAQTSDRALSMVNYIGKEVTLGDGQLKFDGKNTTKSTFTIETPVAEAILEVRNASGAVVASDQLGNLMPGEHPITFSGKAADGSRLTPGLYSFAIVAKGMDGNAVAVPIKSKVKVSGIDLKDQGGSLFTDVGKVKILDVASVGTQGFEDAGAKSQEEDKKSQPAPILNEVAAIKPEVKPDTKPIEENVTELKPAELKPQEDKPVDAKPPMVSLAPELIQERRPTP